MDVIFKKMDPIHDSPTNIATLQELDELETYPVEVLPGFLFLGNWRHGNTAYIQKDLKIMAHVLCELEVGEL